MVEYGKWGVCARVHITLNTHTVIVYYTIVHHSFCGARVPGIYATFPLDARLPTICRRNRRRHRGLTVYQVISLVH